ncbi:hypothetical protein PIB30_028926 [Stylosanthes scabra]|uniref:Uncharacterized protein n=1 Tax=Stylosanthes scabra TaxID=79078 RepID=A0ABU6RBD7_9FABA|nr:hypothetical protein [Stylosanthes scabra]
MPQMFKSTTARVDTGRIPPNIPLVVLAEMQTQEDTCNERRPKRELQHSRVGFGVPMMTLRRPFNTFVQKPNLMEFKGQATGGGGDGGGGVAMGGSSVWELTIFNRRRTANIDDIALLEPMI